MTDDATSFIEITYEELARLGDSDLCCSPIELYSAEELASLPDEILRLSSGCGHPVEDAEIKPGMTVLDIGSGAGTDAILAARQTGPTGTVIGVDPSASMRERATRNAADLGLAWLEFRNGTAESLPVADGGVDLVISNCVLSLSTDPAGAWTEIARTLRPGGQIVVSDIVGGAATETIEAKTRCETGIEWADYQAMLVKLGFSGIRPLRVRAARYRDGGTARSVTIHACHGLSEPRLAVDLIQPAPAITTEFGDRVSLRTLDPEDPADAGVIDLYLGDDRSERDGGGSRIAAIDGLPVDVRPEDLIGYLRDRLE